MTKPNKNQLKLQNNLTNCSEATDFETSVSEWKYTRTIIAPTNAKCICGHHLKTKRHIISNTKNHTQLVVGDTCLKNLFRNSSLYQHLQLETAAKKNRKSSKGLKSKAASTFKRTTKSKSFFDSEKMNAFEWFKLKVNQFELYKQKVIQEYSEEYNKRLFEYIQTNKFITIEDAKGNHEFGEVIVNHYINNKFYQIQGNYIVDIGCQKIKTYHSNQDIIKNKEAEIKRKETYIQRLHKKLGI